MLYQQKYMAAFSLYCLGGKAGRKRLYAYYVFALVTRRNHRKATGVRAGNAAKVGTVSVGKHIGGSSVETAYAAWTFPGSATTEMGFNAGHTLRWGKQIDSQ